MKKVAFLPFLFTATITMCQQATEITVANSSRQKSIERFPDRFFIWPLIKYRTVNFTLQQQTNSSNKLNYRPNNSIGMGFGFYLFEVAAEFTFAVPVQAERVSLFGKTKAQDLQLNLLGKTWGLDLFYQRYNGFYRDDPNAKITPGLAFPQRPDLATRNLGINGLYILNKNFSLRSAYNFSERQLKSAGSFLVAGTLNFYTVGGDSALYSKKYNSVFGEPSAFSKLSINTFSVSPGYSYTQVIRRFFINASLSFGPAYHWISYEVNGQEFQASTLNSFLDIRAGIGYNSNRFFCGINLVNQSRVIKFESLQFTTSSSTIKILVGYRFKEFGVLKKRALDIIPVLVPTRK
jgi:hypothetical protein